MFLRGTTLIIHSQNFEGIVYGWSESSEGVGPICDGSHSLSASPHHKSSDSISVVDPIWCRVLQVTVMDVIVWLATARPSGGPVGTSKGEKGMGYGVYLAMTLHSQTRCPQKLDTSISSHVVHIQ